MEYSNLINRILEVENSARAIADEALERQAHLDEEMAEEKAKIMERYMARAQQQLEALAQSEQAKKEKALAAQENRLKEANRKMELAYLRCGDNWVDTIFHQVVDPQ